jgi:hypothetical protein
MGFLNVVVAENGQNWSNFMFWNYEILKLEPFFFLCNYHGNTQEVGGFDKGEIAVSVSVEGNPEYYTPEQFYNSKSFILTRNDLFVNGNLLIY